MKKTFANKLKTAIMSLPNDIRSRYESKYGKASSILFAQEEEEGGEHSLTKYYTFDERGHIMVVTTSAQIRKTLLLKYRRPFKK